MNKQIIIDYEEYLVLEHINKIHKSEMNKLRNCVVIPDKEYEQLQQQNQQLHNNIDKAIEYIEWQRDNPQYDNVWRNYECNKLIEILKDGDVDGRK